MKIFDSHQKKIRGVFVSFFRFMCRVIEIRLIGGDRGLVFTFSGTTNIRKYPDLYIFGKPPDITAHGLIKIGTD